MKPVDHYGYFKNGRWQMDSFVRMLRSLQGRPVVLTVKEYRPSRSNQANRYYWGVVVDIIARELREAGWEAKDATPEAVHSMLKFRFLREDKPIGTHGDEFVTIVRGTSDLDQSEFGAYIENCVRFAAEYLQTIIPPPGEQSDMQYEDAA